MEYLLRWFAMTVGTVSSRLRYGMRFGFLVLECLIGDCWLICCILKDVLLGAGCYPDLCGVARVRDAAGH